jgi:sigma-B regulation protein RsbU (phosphoserine phosphatase)
MTRIDMNMVELPAGTVLNFTEFSTLRKVVEAQGNIDVNRLAIHAMQNSFLPRFIMFSMVAIMCSEIARKGRSAIFAQQAETQKSERISTELNLASDIQANMLPNIFPAFPSRNDFDIYASMTPAKEVGGDFYDFFMVDDDHLAMVMADVSGKGIPAAMFMVIAKTLIKDHTQLGLQPDEVFTRVNEILCEGNEAGLFVTAWMGILDLNTGKLTYANAGHNPPVVKLGNEVKYLHSKPGFVLAGFEGFKYSKFDLQLQRGDKIFLYTDGATEATNLNNELYGEDRLIECLRSQDGKTCADALHAVRADIDKFVGEAEQFDDLTLLAFDYSPKDKEKNTVERTYDATDENLRTVIAFVEEELEKNEASMKDIMTITVAVEEIFVNICHYAYPGRVGKATVGMNFDEHDVSIYFIDSGIPFDPLAKPDPNVNAKLEDRSIGGLGIYMVKKSMDDCSYERRNNENYFVMRKAIK